MNNDDVKLTAELRKKLLVIISMGSNAVVIRQAHILLKCDEGKSDAAIADVLYITEEVVAQTRQRFYDDGLQAALMVSAVNEIDGQRVVNQGDVYWVQALLESDIAHPYVVIQDNLLNHSRIHTVVACALTANIKRGNLPGNVLLDDGEANLPRQSVVEVSKISTIEKSQLGEYSGSLSEQRVNQVLAGLRLLQSSFLR